MSVRKKKRRCVICDGEMDEDSDICPNCGAYQDEPCYDIEDDLG
jgi:rRNA maturation endonuclease Nob1